MSIKAVAVDMDGTFLNSHHDYDRVRFHELYQGLKNQGIEFIVASGNQYYQLASYFPEIRDEISYVAENGALLYLHGEELFHGEMSGEALKKVYDLLDADKSIEYVACGLHSAYMGPRISQAFADVAANHYQRLERVDNVRAVDDVIFKFSIKTTVEHAEVLVVELAEQLGDLVDTVTSGFGFIDLIIPGLHKANGLQKVLHEMGIAADECVAIGDSLNDKEMLEFVGYSVAMSNAAEKIKAVSRYCTESNDDSGAQNVIERVLKQEAPFV
ncbi:Cof-type HAD-IIB family hydrolase [Vibrio palustris]|uniref:Sugar phosphatase YbiV n=1 Tax=Vibrio palustris TaxID=1918946 RepID=A0A1R4B520_9VIBR|nr:Cof-type HAD-IIB family hydrolase [Vibrio palustris]SJL83981.1 Sugar phosphatase YbiV [Vibrio palustris]